MYHHFLSSNRESGSSGAAFARTAATPTAHAGTARLTSARSPRSACRVRPAPGRSREMGTTHIADGHPNRSDPRSPLPGVRGYTGDTSRSAGAGSRPRGRYTYTIHNDKNGPGAPPPPTQAGRAGTSRGSTSCAPSLHTTYVADGVIVYSSHEDFTLLKSEKRASQGKGSAVRLRSRCSPPNVGSPNDTLNDTLMKARPLSVRCSPQCDIKCRSRGRAHVSCWPRGFPV